MELKETEVRISDNGGYKNIYPKGKDSAMVDPMPFNSYIKIQKMYPNGIEKDGKYGKFYTIKVGYNDDEVGMILNPKEHESYLKAGEVGDEIKLIVRGEQYTKNVNGQSETKTKRVVSFES